MAWIRNKQPVPETLPEQLEEPEYRPQVPQQPAKIEKANAPIKKVSVETLVVRELPTQAVRLVTLDDGTKAELITIEEALAKILKILEA